MSNIACLKNIASFLNEPIENIALNSEKLPVINNKENTTGFVNIVLKLIRNSKSSLKGENELDRAHMKQWLEYCVTYVLQCSSTQSTNQVLQELNEVLAPRTYLIGNYMTIADIALFYLLQNTMRKLTHGDKEKYINISRWFDNLQQNNMLKDKLVDFSTIFLASISVH